MPCPKDLDKLKEYKVKQRIGTLNRLKDPEYKKRWVESIRKSFTKERREKMSKILKGRIYNSFYKQCEFCKKEFHCFVSNKTRYCSRKCYIESPIRKLEYGKRNKEYWIGKKRKNDLRPHQGNTHEYIQWRKSVFERDNYTCQNCKTKGYLEAHHIKRWSLYPKLRFEITNGITLCKTCHKEANKLNKK